MLVCTSCQEEEDVDNLKLDAEFLSARGKEEKHDDEEIWYMSPEKGEKP
jgi:hypothetical protein